ncbi:MAG TPA: MBOAT family protein [Polyangiaceae bacterium]|nr:MBOAT family protein [Polyangiaceae bacterium]
MPFNTLAFAKFFGVVFIVSWLLVRLRVARIVFLLLASYAFYAHWDYRFLPLIFGSSSLDFWLARAIARAPDARHRKRWLWLTVVVNLSVLGFFKYANFGLDTLSPLLTTFGVSRPTLEIALPIGISFFTFESMSYVIDVYRGDIEPHPSYLEYLTFVAFFPHLVAGPIVRPRDLLPQLAAPGRFSNEAGAEGLFAIAIGLVKKIVIADFLAINLVDRVFQAPLQYSSLECYAAAVGYALQIYCDFSGYTDIASGCALLLGVRFPRNFDAPYTAVNIADFWRRWHISLSTWLRDYLYIPLGGNRHGPTRTYVNLLLTMLLGGLWHGANWTFVAWGGLHGAALALTRAYQDLPGSRKAATFGAQRSLSLPRRVLQTVLTFHLVLASWILFRSETFTQARIIFGRIFQGTLYHPNLDARVLLVMLLGLTSHFVPDRWFAAAQAGFCRLPALAQAALLFCVSVLLRNVASAEAVPFVYFQF